MALSRAHLAEENKTHFPFASMFLCMFFLEFLCRAIGKGQLVPHYIYTRAISSGEISRVVWSFSQLKKNTWELQQMQEMFQAILCALHKIVMQPFFFLSANIFRIRFQDWDLSATGVLLFRICKNYCTLITYTDLIHNF